MFGAPNRTLAWLSVAALLVAGCSSAPADYLSAEGDSCRTERGELKAVDDYFNQQLIEGAVIGAVGGAAAGALTGFLVGGKGSSAAIGAAAGLAAGAVGGYFIAKRDASQNRDLLVQTIYDDVSRENTQVTRATAALEGLTKCRLATSARINQAYQAGSLSRAEAEKQIARERDLYSQDVTLARGIGGQMQKRTGDLAFAVQEVEKLPPGPIVAETASTTTQRPAAKAQPQQPKKVATNAPAPSQKLTKPTQSLLDGVNSFDKQTNDAPVVLAQMQLKTAGAGRDEPEQPLRLASKCSRIVLSDCGA